MTHTPGNGVDPTVPRRYRFEAKVPIPVLVQTAGNWQAGHLHNLSPRGAFMTLDADVWVGEEVNMILGFADRRGKPLESSWPHGVAKPVLRDAWLRSDDSR